MKQFFIALICVVISLCLLPVLLVPANHRTPQRERAASAGSRVIDAMHRYRKEYGHWPSGTQAEIIQALRGDNEKAIVFLDLPAEQLTAGGELPDPWGTPYRIAADPQSKWARVHSAGPDGVFDESSGRSDDHVSRWSASSLGIPGLPF